jgi:hypothetical protein
METKIDKIAGAGAVVALVSIVALVNGCGGRSNGGSAGTCGKVQPCGGSIVGTWTVHTSCGSIGNFTGGVTCTGATLDESMKVTSGTLTFNADMTYATTVAQSGTIKFKAPLSCTSAASCDELATSIYPMPPDATSTCTTANAVCDCSIVYSGPMTGTDSGTYTTAGNVVTLTPSSGGPPIPGSYCVQGNELHLPTIGETTGTIIEDVVATR